LPNKILLDFRYVSAMHVDRREGESVEQLIRRFNKGVVAERITKTYREKMYFISKGEQRKEKRRRAERNRRKRERMTPRF
jgi:small subunit ribosomal protein S21